MLCYLVLHRVNLKFQTFDKIFIFKSLDPHNLVKDIILTLALLISFGACTYAFIRHRKTEVSMQIMLKELATLQKAEGDLIAVTGK